MHEIDHDGDGDAAGGGLVTDRVDLLAVAVDQRDPGPLMGGVAAFGLVEHGRDDGGDVVGEVGRYNATALASGWQIATGIIEGAARFLIKDRMDITGARWSTPGAQAVLRLRAVTANGDFDEYWQYHQQQEVRRNHLNRYQELDLAA